MTNTTNYNLLLAEGTDLVNYLTQTNPNFTTLDSVIKGVSDATITPATEVTVGTAHAITRSLPDCPVIRFTATSNWVTGDTITVDGTSVTALKTDGTTLKSGDYVIGSEVLAILEATRLTMFVSASPAADDINYDNTSSGLTANKVQGAIDENAQNISDLTSDMGSYLTVRTGNASFDSIPALSTVTASFTVPAVSGYIPILAFYGYNNASSNVITSMFSLELSSGDSGQTKSVTLRNLGNSAIISGDHAAVYRILYRKII